MDSDDPKTNNATAGYDCSFMNDTTFTETGVPVDKPKDDPVTENDGAVPPHMCSPRKKLDPQLLENFYINLDRTTETAIQGAAQSMHAVVNDIVAGFEIHRQETLEANLANCRDLMKDIQQMEAEQDTMKYQIDLYTQKVRQAHQQAFTKNAEKE